MKTVSLALAALWSLSSALGCRSTRATPDECARILDRIVDLELHERGFRDPALASRKRDDVRRLLAPEIAECAGKPLRSGALACVEHATSTEQISHDCLR